MKILVVNVGSSSLKCSVYTLDSDAVSLTIPADWSGQIDWNDINCSYLLSARNIRTGSHIGQFIEGSDRELAIQKMLQLIASGETKVVSDHREIDGVGHRIVHGGTKYSSSVMVTEQVLNDLKKLIEVAPSHELENIRGIEVAERAFPDRAQVAVFDTAFHNSMPEVAKIYPGPYEWYQKFGIRRHGFHGISHEYCAKRAAQIVGGKPQSLRIITCHLGSGASLCAIKNQKSLMTTMGFTPLEGVVMRTRSGSIDPGLILHLLKNNIYSVDELAHILNHESGLKGISGLTGDMKDIEREASQGNLRAQLAFDVFVQSIASHIASLLPILGGLDVLAFAGGIGENSIKVRAAVCELLAFSGVHIDHEKNQCLNSDTDISSPEANVRTLVIRSREDLAIAIECFRLMQSNY